jgi:DNA-binding transcriptional LysR family regulator
VPLRVARRHADRFGLRMVAPPRTLGLEPYQIAQLWHPRNDRDLGHRWLRESVATAAKAATRSRS